MRSIAYPVTGSGAEPFLVITMNEFFSSLPHRTAASVVTKGQAS
jgi:hypothetical protein